MAVEVAKIDSNVTGLSIAEEETLGTLPSSPTWYTLEPNSYNDFGGSLTLVARNPINTSRQRKKGVITDLDASGGFNQDLTFSNLSFLWEGLFLANKRTKPKNTAGSTTTSLDITGVTATGYTLGTGGGAAYQGGLIILAQGFTNAANNGLKVLSAVATDEIQTSGLVLEASPPAGANVQVVGFEYGSGDADIAYTGGSLPVLQSTTADPTTFNLIPGEFIFIGGDDTGLTGDAFNAAQNNGFARVNSLAASGITLDKTSGGADGITEMLTEAGGTKLIRIFFADVTRNEDSLSTDFNRRSYAVERTLGKPNPTGDNTQVQSEVLRGAIVNEFALNIAQADKITTDWTLIATNNEQRDGLNPGSGGGDERVLSETVGTVSTIEAATAYNTSSDFTRIKMAEVRPTQSGVANLAAPSPLFAFVTEITLNANNNASPNKAVGVLGAFDVTAGTFEVSGSITAYFADVEATKAVRNNADVTLDIAIVKDFGDGTLARKAGIVMDIPLIALGDGRLNVEQDEAITLPLTTDAAEDENFGHTLLVHEFFWLPDAADT